MSDPNARPRFLAKMPGGPGSLSLRFGASTQAFTVAPLFRSIGSGRARGVAATNAWQILTPSDGVDVSNPWQACHDLMQANPAVTFVEPDLTQQWMVGRPTELGLGLAKGCDVADAQNPQYPTIPKNNFWFRDNTHGQYDAALAKVGDPGAGKRVRIAHLDTGFDPGHETLPSHLNRALQKNFVDDDRPDDASDDSSGLFNNLGHGTGTLSILAGAGVNGGKPIGVAPYAEVVPIRVANRVVLFSNSAIAQAFDYVHQLCRNSATRVHVVTMSMGGIASQAWAEAVNALYDAGVFVVTAAGNNYANLPTREIVYPARFSRVVAACGVMADGSPYADLAANLMAGNYGPPQKMASAVAAFTPNTPWARFGCAETVDFDGNGTSAATPQVAATAALWIQKNRTAYERYSKAWMRVEAVRNALFASARAVPGQSEHFGRGKLAALDALDIAAARETALTETEPDNAFFPLLKLITGLGVTEEGSARQAMLELEALQVAQSSGLEAEVSDLASGAGAPNPRAITRIADALLAKPGLSKPLRAALETKATIGSVSVEPVSPPKAKASALPASSNPVAAMHLQMAKQPQIPAPLRRLLRVFAYDPSSATDLAMAAVNNATVDVRWEDDLEAGPVGEYLEVVDMDPASGCCYAPVDLNHPYLLAQNGLQPSEANPQFHQQMSYAVAMRTIEHFERALGRKALWSARFRTDAKGKVIGEDYVQRLRIYPHALRAANSFYSPDRKALLLGYFRAAEGDAGNDLPGGRVFCAVSHDIVAHETTHALLDGLHRRYQEATNPDVLAFHEAFADIVALFQHFTVTEALLHQIRLTRGDLGKESLLGQLAVEFGSATRGGYGALRDAIGSRNKETGQWEERKPQRSDYASSTEPHARGSILVAAIFAAYLAIYRTRSSEIIRLATNGSGVLPPGEISEGLARSLCTEAGKVARQVLGMCIRALDYCPPVDITFGDYLRALVTADRDLVADDIYGYRIAFISAFRDRGIFPENVQSLSIDSLIWEPPPMQLEGLGKVLDKMRLDWNQNTDRRSVYDNSRANARLFREWILDADRAREFDVLGFVRDFGAYTVSGVAGTLRPIEVHSVRRARRVGPDGQSRSSLVIEITQSFHPDNAPGRIFRGGCTLLIDLDTYLAHYFIRKSLKRAVLSQAAALQVDADQDQSLRSNYFGRDERPREPFALLHGLQ